MSTRYDLSDPEQREAGLAAAVTAVRRGQLVVLPTDTVYGIGVDAFDADGVQRLLDAKGRGRDMPPPVLISAATTLEALATELPGWAHRPVRALLARAADHRVPPAALPAVGPRRQPAAPSPCGCPTTRPPSSCSTAPARWRSPRPTSTGQPAATDADAAEEMLG